MNVWKANRCDYNQEITYICFILFADLELQIYNDQKGKTFK